MSGLHDSTSPLRGAAQGDPGPWRDCPNALLHQRPGGFNRIEIVRVRGQEAQGGAGLLDQLTDLPRFVGGQIVHEDHVPAAQVQKPRSPYYPRCSAHHLCGPQTSTGLASAIRDTLTPPTVDGASTTS